MELKAGYKLSEVGVIPNDWEVTTFDMIADKNKKWSITGGPFGSNLKVSDYTLNGVQIVQLQNIGDGNFIDDSQIYTSEEKANELLSCNIYPNEIIISKMGDPVARACFIPNKAKRFLMASDGIRLVVNEKEFSKKFIHDYINSVYFRKRAFENSRGSTRLRIGLPELKCLLVIKPKLFEQTAIATALSDADALISSLEKLLTKKRNIKQGAMQKLLQPKEGWEVKKLGDFLEKIVGGGTPSRSNKDFWGDEIPWVTVKDFATFNPYFTQEYITKNGLENSASHLIPKGILVTPTRMGLGKAVIYNVDVSINQDLKALFPSKNLDTLYLYYWFQKNSELIEKMGSGSTVMGISLNELRNISFSAPPKQEQTHIATILSDMDAEISALESKLEKYRNIKLGMMQNLLTGKIRLI